MTRSDVSIVNRALDLLGSSSISSLSDNSNSARAMSRAYDPIRTQLLQRHDWSFARKRAQLAQLSTSPLFGFKNAYVLPNDYIRVLEIHPRYLLYRVEGNSLLTNNDSCFIAYIANVIDPNQFTPEFSELLSKDLAKSVCFKITNSRTLQVDLEAEYKKYFLWATSNDSKMAGTPVPFSEDAWMINRGYGAWDDPTNAEVSDNFNYGSVT